MRADRTLQDMDASLVTTLPSADPSSSGKKSGKKGKKLRSVWISFFGRIVAQFVGSAATVLLGLLLLHKYQSTGKTGAEHAAAHVERSGAVSPAALRQAGELWIAVLPFHDASPDVSSHAEADDFADMLMTELAQVPGLHLVSRTSPASLAKQQRTVTDIAGALGVHYVLEGSIAHTKNKLRVTVKLVDASTDEQVWARRYERDVRDIIATGDAVSAAVAGDLQDTLARRGHEIPSTGPNAAAATTGVSHTTQVVVAR